MRRLDIQPAPGKLMVEVDDEDEKTAGGIVIPDTSIEKANLATVVAASTLPYFNGAGWIDPVARVGDRVLIGRYAGLQVKYEGVEYVVLKHEEVLAVVAPAPVEVAGGDA